MERITPRSIVCSLLLGLLTIQLGTSEPFHLYRDPSAGMKRPQINRNRVLTTDQCMIYLCKYGYLKCSCQAPRSRDKRQLIDGIFPNPSEWNDGALIPDTVVNPTTTVSVSATASGALCKGTDLRVALEIFQKTYRLPVTGLCDAATKDYMSQSRCGLPDPINNMDDSLAVKITAPSTTRPKRSLVEMLSHSAQLERVIERRKRQLDEYRRSIVDEVVSNGGSTRDRRSISLFNVSVNDDYGGIWQKSRITWRLMSEHYSNLITPQNQRSILRQAFRYWGEVSPMCFLEDNSSPRVDIEIGFLEGIHLSCVRQFDGFGGELAHKFQRDVHFDKSEPYTVDVNSNSAISLLLVAVHELGHVMGFNHTDNSASVMNAIYHTHIHGDFELSDFDRQEVKRVYGSCNGSFDTVFDFVRWRATPQGQDQRVFNTYFFRNNHYWMYENSNNRARYGDPMEIGPQWAGLPNQIQAFLHYSELRILSNGAKQLVDEYFFFKADKYYLYNSMEDKVQEEGYIRNKFPAGPLGEPIPSNLDSAFFDMRDKLSYFFKGEWVYIYQYKNNMNTSCCVSKQKIVDAFPPKTPSDLITSSGNTYIRNIDAVYFSYYSSSFYIIRGDDVWKNELFVLQQPGGLNLMKYVGKWNTVWYFLCDGDCT